jgi:translation initiation factor 3 subunit E
VTGTKIGPYLDRLLDFPLLEFLSDNEYYDETDLLRGQALDLLSNTSIPDQEVPLARHSAEGKMSKVVENFKKLQAETEPILKIFDQEVTSQIQQPWDS